MEAEATTPTTTTTLDADLASYMILAGLRLLRCEAAAPRARFVLSDPDHHADSYRRAFIGDARLRRFLAVRRMLINAVPLARECPGHICTARPSSTR